MLVQTVARFLNDKAGARAVVAGQHPLAIQIDQDRGQRRDLNIEIAIVRRRCRVLMLDSIRHSNHVCPLRLGFFSLEFFWDLGIADSVAVEIDNANERTVFDCAFT